MRKFKVYYAKQMPFFFDQPELAISDLAETHVLVKEIEAADVNEVFYQMQGEVWSPNGEARELIRSLGLDHTSMSVGDVIYDVESQTYLRCNPFGWSEITA